MRRTLSGLGGWLVRGVLPVAAAYLTLGWLIPARIDAGARGPLAALARVRDEHPLVLGLALVWLFGAAARHWWPRTADADAAASSWRRTALALAGVIGLVLGARAVVGRVHRVSGPSMMPTLNDGDRVYVDELAYGVRLPFASRALAPRPVRRGDVVVFPNDRHAGTAAPFLVKRVIGLPGDVVTFTEGAPTINGWVVPSCDAGPIVVGADERLVRGRLTIEVLDEHAYLTIRTPFDDTRGSFTVPPGQLFVLGDDRGVSVDSRRLAGSAAAGIPLDGVVGRVTRILLAASTGGALDFGHPFRALGLSVRQPDIDLASLDRRVATCLAHWPPSSSPPPAPASLTAAR